MKFCVCNSIEESFFFFFFYLFMASNFRHVHIFRTIVKKQHMADLWLSSSSTSNRARFAVSTEVLVLQRSRMDLGRRMALLHWRCMARGRLSVPVMQHMQHCSFSIPKIKWIEMKMRAWNSKYSHQFDRYMIINNWTSERASSCAHVCIRSLVLAGK